MKMIQKLKLVSLVFVAYSDMFVQARSSYASLKNSVDIVFALTYVKIPNLPLIMGGHEHTNSCNTIGNLKIAKATQMLKQFISIEFLLIKIAKADTNTKTVYIHRISFNKKTKKISVKSELKEINTTINI